jgi:hypothetical protein
MIENALRPGEYLETGATQEVLAFMPGITFEMQLQEIFNLLRGEHARRVVCQEKQDEFLAVDAADI